MIRENKIVRSSLDSIEKMFALNCVRRNITPTRKNAVPIIEKINSVYLKISEFGFHQINNEACFKKHALNLENSLKDFEFKIVSSIFLIFFQNIKIVNKKSDQLKRISSILSKNNKRMLITQKNSINLEISVNSIKRVISSINFRLYLSAFTQIKSTIFSKSKNFTHSNTRLLLLTLKNIVYLRVSRTFHCIYNHHHIKLSKIINIINLKKIFFVKIQEI